MQNVAKAILLIITYFITITSTFASPGVNTLTQDISTQCQTLELQALLALNNSLADLIRDECSAWNPASDFTTTDESRVQMHNTANTLSDVATIAFSRINRGGPAFGGAKTGASANPEINRHGLNAGGMFNNVSVWGSFNYINLDDDFINTTYDSDTQSFLVGADVQPQENMVAGLAFGYEDTDVETLFNSGEQDRSGYTIAGYLGYLINKNISIDASAGYSDIEYDQFRRATAADPNFFAIPGSIVSSDVDADRFFIAGNVNGFWVRDNWLLGATAGLLWGEEDQDNFTESGGGITAAFTGKDFQTGTFRIGGNIAYDYQSVLEPYFGVEYLNDFERDDIRLSPGLKQHENDDDEFLFTLGVRYFGNQGFSGDFNFNISAGREDIDNSNLMLMLRAEL